MQHFYTAHLSYYSQEFGASMSDLSIEIGKKKSLDFIRLFSIKHQHLSDHIMIITAPISSFHPSRTFPTSGGKATA